MSFVSSIFWVFSVLLFILYFWWPSRYRWVLMLVASYAFYAYWDWRYTPLLLFSTAVDYICVHKMSALKTKKEKKPWLWLSLTINLGILFAFKYWNFFGTNLNDLIGTTLETHHLLLPLGISFYTFQSLSYTFDSYSEKIKPERHFGYFCLYVSFFPQLVAGPIERSQSLLPQVKKLGRATIEQFRHGLMLIIWGLFLKLVIADNLTSFINSIYFNDGQLQFWFYWVAGVLVSFKIYCDFMAYSEIARGLAQLFGVKLTKNFRRPFLAKDLADFWQRWHISLTRWIGVYIQIPLLKSFTSAHAKYLVTVATMSLIGLWHGASWNFVIFGLYHGIALVAWKPVSTLFQSVFSPSKLVSSILARASLGFILITGSTLFYISDTKLLVQTFSYMFDFSSLISLYSLTEYHLSGKFMFAKAACGLFLLSLYSFIAEYRKIEMVDNIASGGYVSRYCCFVALLLGILLLGNFNAEDFVYFEF